MKKFMDEDFMLQNDTAKILYHEYAAKMPIYDYHCHVIPSQIKDDTSFDNITQVWLYGDHYKWRLMRTMGIDEKYITGNASDYERFEAFAKTVPECIGNPMYHWVHLELKRYFGIDTELNEKTAPEIYERANAVLRGGLSVRKIIEQSNVTHICTTDDPIDDLENHRLIREDTTMHTKVLPAFRPDKVLRPTREYLEKLSEVSKVEIHNFEDIVCALEKRIEFFHENGCRLSDHAFQAPPFRRANTAELDRIVSLYMAGAPVSAEDAEAYQTELMLYLSHEYSKRGWTMQLHMAALRDNNTRMFKLLGPDTGFDSIDDVQIARPLSALLDAMEEANELPKTILYSLNPRDNYVLATMLGNFAKDIPGKLQLGSGWWFNDQRDGMEAQMKALANLGLFSKFVGMLTDSRSFLSYTRHEYFRRILCNLIGTWVEAGEYTSDLARLGEIVQNISYNNAVRYFDM